MKKIISKIKSKILRLDNDTDFATQANSKYHAKPEGVTVYHEFPLVIETMTEVWCLGVITEYIDPDGCSYGDAFVVAPDGSRAGLVWDVGREDVLEISAPDETRWGVYQVWFSRPIRTTDDLVVCFREALPQLKLIHGAIQKGKCL